MFLSFKRDEIGSSAVEYALILSLIAAVIIPGVTHTGMALSSTFADLAEAAALDGSGADAGGFGGGSGGAGGSGGSGGSWF